MRKLVWLCGLFLALAVPAMAQDEPKFDLFGGYSYVRANLQGDTHANLNGGSGAVAYYPGRHLGVVADFGGYKLSHATSMGTGFDVNGTIFSYLFGPRFRFPGERATPFVQALFGGAHASSFTSGGSTVTSSDNAFAMTLGGGVDIKVATHFAIRGQAEYFLTRFKDITSSTGARASQNNARISVGIVIH